MDFKHNFKKYGILPVRPPPPVGKIPNFFFFFFLKASLREKVSVKFFLDMTRLFRHPGWSRSLDSG